MMNLRIFSLLALWLTCTTAWAQDPCRFNDPNPALIEIPEAVQTLEWVRAGLLSVLSPAELEAVKSVKICSPSLLGIADVAALVRADSAVPLVVFGYNSFLALEEVGRAIAISRIPSIDGSYLQGYVRYRASPYRFGELPMTAREFAARLGPQGTEAQVQAMTEVDFLAGEGTAYVLVLFVLAHELAHHVHGDVRAAGRPAERQREDEAQADEWAVAKMLQMGVDPALASASMLLLNEIEGKSAFAQSLARHPPSLERAIAIISESERMARNEPEWIKRFLLMGTPNSTTLAADVGAYTAALARMRAESAKMLSDERQLLNDNDFLLERARAGSTKARMSLAFHYGSGNRQGIPQDWQKARYWIHLAAIDSAPYEYDYRADSLYTFGHYHLAPGGDASQACASFRQAAAMNHLASRIYLDRLKSDRRC